MKRLYRYITKCKLFGEKWLGITKISAIFWLHAGGIVLQELLGSFIRSNKICFRRLPEREIPEGHKYMSQFCLSNMACLLYFIVDLGQTPFIICIS